MDDLMKFYIEGGIALFVFVAFIAYSLLAIKERHRDVAAWHVHVGAGIYGAIFGLFLGFLAFPLRLTLMQDPAAATSMGPWGLGVFVLLIAMRRGLIGRLPFLGPQVRAYRRAFLRRTLEGTQKQLDKMLEKDGIAGQA